MTRVGRLSAVLATSALLAATLVGASLSLREDGIQFPDGSFQRTAAAPAGDPVLIPGSCVIPDDSDGCGATIYTVPTGRLLVIETLSYSALQLSPTEVLLPSLTVTSGGTEAVISFEQMSGGTVYPYLTINSGPPLRVQLYADPDTTVGISGLSTSLVGLNRVVEFRLAGRLVDVGP